MNNSLPIGNLIYELAAGIADAQVAMDLASFRQASILSGQLQIMESNPHTDSVVKVIDTRIPFGYEYKGETRQSKLVSMLELGFSAHFYQFVENIIDVQISVTVRRRINKRAQQETNTKVGSSFSSNHHRLSSQASTDLMVTSMEAGHINRFQLNQKSSSKVSVKISPVPAPVNIDQGLELIQLENARKYQSLPSSLSTKLEHLKGVGQAKKAILIEQGFHTCQQVVEQSPEGFIEQFEEKERRFMLSLHHKVSSYCRSFRLPFLVDIPEMNLAELVSKSSGIYSRENPDEFEFLNYVYILDMVLDYDYLLKLDSSTFFNS